MPKPAESLKLLDRWVGTWTTEATHPAMPGLVVHGTAVVEWLEGQKFLIHRARTDHPDFPDSISILGFTERDRVGERSNAGESRLEMHYYDSRGVHRVYDFEASENTYHIARPAPGLSQRFTGKLIDGGNTIDGLWQMCEDDVTFHDDLKIVYRRGA